MRTLSTLSRGISWLSAAAYLHLLSAQQVLAFGGTIPNIETADSSVGVRGAVTNIINWALSFLALVAVVMVIVGGFRILASGGNEENVTKGRKMIFMAIIGIVVIFFARVIVSFFTTELNSQVSGGGGGVTP